MQEIASCEVCGNVELVEVLNLGSHPLCDDLVKVGESRVCEVYPIVILLCTQCLTAHQKYQVNKKTLFPRSYHYRSRFTADVVNGMRGLVEDYEIRFGLLDGKKVLDVGCNDGSLLNIFKEKGALTFGIEPTGAASEADQAAHKILNEFFSVDLAKKFVKEFGRPDLITFTNVFAHIENLGELLLAVKSLMSSSTVLIVENHYLGSILDLGQFDTFYHEHPRTYSYKSFKFISKSLGRSITGIDFPERYGGNIRVYIGGSNGNATVDDERPIAIKEDSFEDSFGVMAQKLFRWRREKRDQIDKLIRKHGALRAKAFPGRAAILVKLLGLTDSHIAAVYERPGSMKIGSYVPGTKIQIRSDEELFLDQDRSSPIVNFAWHISDEIRNYLSTHGFSSPVIDLLEPQEKTGV